MAVVAGSIAFVAYSFDDADEGFSFVTLGPIGPNESIRFVDGQWNSSGGTITEESSIVWTNRGTTLPAGSVVQIDFTTKGTGGTNTGFNKAQASVGTVSDVTGPQWWNVSSSDSLYAITGTPAQPGEVAAAIVWGGTNTAGLPAETNLLNLASVKAAAGNNGTGNTVDVGSINAVGSDATYASVAALRDAATNNGNWVRDGNPTGGSGTNNAEWPARSDTNSPLRNQDTIALSGTHPETTTIRLAQDTGSSGTDGLTSAPALTGTVSNGASGVRVAIRDGGTVVGTAITGAGGVWTFDNTNAGNASHTYSAAVEDRLGNLGKYTATTPATTTTDTTPPASGGTVTLSNPGGDGIQHSEANDYAFAVSGVSGGTATVTFTSSGGGAPVVVSGLGNGDHTVDLGGLPSGKITARISASDPAGNTMDGTDASIDAVICFYPGTLVATPSGGVAVEALKAGDLVLTAGGGAEPVRWMGRQTVSTRFADPLRVLPVRIAAGALGENLPARDLLVSPDHALLVDGVLVQAGALVNGGAVRREWDVPEAFTYWHVELADHSLVLAEGVPAETFVDNVARLAFDNWDEHDAAGTAAPIAEMALPRAKSARQVPAATRRRLADRAAALLGERAVPSAA